MSKEKIRIEDITSMIARLDLFGAPAAPRFNVQGKENVNTCVGGVLSFMLLTITILFGTVKLDELLEKRNPTISSLKEYGANRGTKFDLS